MAAGVFFYTLLLLFVGTSVATTRYGDPSVPRTPDEYERCKATHRCPRAFSWYDVPSATYGFASSAYKNGHLDACGLFSDFENWEHGSRGWGHNLVPVPRASSNFDSFDFELLGPLTTDENMTLIFDTSEVVAQLRNATDHVIKSFVGQVNLTAGLTEVAVFNFDVINIVRGTTVLTQGDRAIALLSRSSISIDSSIHLAPNTLGGFPGGKDIGFNNINGPGSPSARVYLFTVRTRGADIREVQQVTTSANPGQTLGGTFTLAFRGGTTHPIPHNASPELFKARLERATKNVGKVFVSRSRPTDSGGYTWLVTFLTATGDLPQLKASSQLIGLGSEVSTSTITEGNTIGGSFRLKFLDQITEPIQFNSTSQNMQEILLEGLKSKVNTVLVQRSDALGELSSSSEFGPCDHGLCVNGPGKAKGYVWTLTLTTNEGNIVPTSPTSPLTNMTGPVENLTISSVDVSLGINATVEVFSNHQFLTHALSFTNLPHISSPFTVSFTGSGASHASPGKTNSENVVASSYADPVGISTTLVSNFASAHSKHSYARKEIYGDLLGGSGGGIGGVSLCGILSHYPPAGLGGHGGGAIELFAVNDIVLRPNASISVPGSDGQDAAWGGGGGSAGAILISAGGTVWIQAGAKLSAVGGKGGRSYAINNAETNNADGSGGRIAVFAKSVTFDAQDSINVGDNTGSIHILSDIGAQAHIDNVGAAGTSHSLKLNVRETVKTPTEVQKRSPYVRNGLVFDVSNYTQPNRVTVFLKIGDDSTLAGTVRDISTAYIALHDFNKSDVATMIGTAAVNGNFNYESNFVHTPTKQLYKGVQQEVWYKFDFLIDWSFMTFTIRLDDVALALDRPFVGTGLESIGLYNFHESVVWYDEIYVGRDDSMFFRCPQIAEIPPDAPVATRAERQSIAKLNMKRPTQTDWNDEWLGQQSSYTEMTRHRSHLSRREVYTSSENHGVAFGTGGLHQMFKSEVGDNAATRVPKPGGFNKGLLLHTDAEPGQQVGQDVLQRSKSIAGEGTGWKNGNSEETTAAKTGRFYWFGEHNNPVQTDEESHLKGGIVSCSTTDFVTWRNEGTMVHYRNLSYTGGVPRLRIDLHGGYDGIGVPTAGKRHTVEIAVEETVAQGNWTNTSLVAERPKVLFNNVTNQFVMWSEVHDSSNELGVTVVATSGCPGGPFELHDVFLPDGNQTHDQTIIKRPNGDAFLVRTYYATIDYVLPEPVMQPLWESVKDDAGEIDFGLNYHRSTYHILYDDSNDICIQRVRKEHLPAEIAYTPQNESMPVSEWIKNAYSGNGTLTNFVLSEQAEPWKTRRVIGQGDPVVISRFKHPNWTSNNHWVPNSVPAVKAQEWTYNYKDLNIADNVVHDALPDKLIGPPQVVEQRRAKYIAVSLLTADYLNTSGVMSIYEGFVEDGQDLAAIISDLNEFNFDVSSEPGWYERRFFPEQCDGGALDDEWERCNEAPKQEQESTAPGQVWGLGAPFNFKTEYDWSWRYHQYRWEFNDRKDSPVNFIDQRVDWFEPGRGESRTTRGRAFMREYDHNCFRGPNNYPIDDPNYIPADPLFNHVLSQHYTKTENSNISLTRAHLYDW